MPTRDDDFDEFPSTDEIERVVKRALRRYGYEAGDPEDESTYETRLTADDAVDHMTSTLRRCGLVASPALNGEPHPLATAGPKLKDLRGKSGWTLEEIAERTGMSAELLAAFESGDSAAAGELTSFHLEHLASACCGTLADLLGPEHLWVKAQPRRPIGRGGSIDPHG